MHKINGMQHEQFLVKLPFVLLKVEVLLFVCNFIEEWLAELHFELNAVIEAYKIVVTLYYFRPYT